jgi:hypothetical protein
LGVDNILGGDSWVDGFCNPSDGGWTYTDVVQGWLDDPTQPGMTVIDASTCTSGYDNLEHFTTVLPPSVSVPDAASAVIFRAAPKPMRSEVSFEYSAELAGSSVVVFDATGRQVASMTLGAGHTSWGGRTRDGARVSAGVYFYRLDRPDARSHRLVVIDG